MQTKPFITDTGAPMEVTSEGKHVMTLPRYGVWVKDGDVIEVSDDLAYLQKKYNVPDSDVHKL